jgi:crossover junction endodeoxyribonuclease RuvC
MAPCPRFWRGGLSFCGVHVTGGRQLILGVDPGSRRTGYALLCQQGRKISIVDSGTISLDGGEPIAWRLGQLQQRLEEVLARQLPAAVAVEDVFLANNARSALVLGQARGAVLAAIGRHGLPLYSYPPATVKRAVVGHGRGGKAQIQQVVSALLGLERAPKTDEADAMAVAICHAMASRVVVSVGRVRS